MYHPLLPLGYTLGKLNPNRTVVTGQLGNKGGDNNNDNNNNNKRDLPAIDVDSVRAAAAVVGRVPDLPRHLAEAVQSGALAPSAKFRRMLQEA